jgi:hypothetical protein
MYSGLEPFANASDVGWALHRQRASSVRSSALDPDTIVRLVSWSRPWDCAGIPGPRKRRLSQLESQYGADNRTARNDRHSRRSGVNAIDVAKFAKRFPENCRGVQCFDYILFSPVGEILILADRTRPIF